jgi:hypothetical protein
MKKYLLFRIVYAGLCAFIFVAVLTDKTSGQGYLPGDPLQFYLRLLPSDSLSVHEMDNFGGGASADVRNFDTGLLSNLNHPWQHRGMLRTGVNIRNYDVHLIPYAPQFYVSNNSDLPVGGNDGALWQGVGNNVAVSTGFQVQYGAFTLNVRPVFVFSENKEFEVSPIPADELMSAGTRISQFARPLVRGRLSPTIWRTKPQPAGYGVVGFVLSAPIMDGGYFNKTAMDWSGRLQSAVA